MSPGTSTIRRVAAVLMALPLLGCAIQAYRPQPLEPARIAAELGARRSDDDALRAFLEGHGAAFAEWPPRQWDLPALTLMAVYFHPDMDVARANLELQRAAQLTAGQRPNPKASPLLEHHTGQGTVDSPWSLGLGLDILIELGDKREARVARAEQLSEEARLSIAETAWRVRSRLRQRFVETYAAEAASALLKREFDIRSREAAMLERREKAGEASPSEVTLARLHLQETHLAVDGSDGDMRAARAGLAEALGLPFDRVEAMPLDFGTMTSGEIGNLPAETVQRAALQNRLDLRQGLARYAAAEAALREEIARQYPDLNLSPNLLWDQGDWVTGLGAAILLPLLNKNEGSVAEAEAGRKLEAARFTSLEAAVFAELSAVRVRFEAALKSWNTAKGLVARQNGRLDDIKKLIAHGEADRLSLVEAEIELIAAERAELRAKIEALKAWGAVEDAVQRPLDGGDFPTDFDGAAPPDAGAKPEADAK